jgi:agmatinase
MTILQSGIPTFMRAPFVDYPNEKKLKKAGADAAILGVPYEDCNVGIPGDSYGPREIRLGSSDVWTYNVEFDLDIAEHFKFVDCGDVILPPGNKMKSFKEIQKAVSRIAGAGVMPIVLGGDHSITFPAFKGFSEHVKGKIGIIHFDSHMDAADALLGDRFNDATWVPRVAELERVNPKNIAQIGMHGWLNVADRVREMKEVGEKLGIRTFFLEEVLKRGIEEVTKEAIEIAHDGTEAVYLTIDVDVFDSAFVPATECPTPGGLTSREMIQAVRLIGRSGVNAMDVCGVGGPFRDWNFMTGRTVAVLIAEVMGSIVLRKLGR